MWVVYEVEWVYFLELKWFWSSLLASSAMVIAASSARLIVHRFVGILFQYVWWCGFLGLLWTPPSVGLPVTRDPSV